MSNEICVNCGQTESDHGHLGMPDIPICPSFTFFPDDNTTCPVCELPMKDHFNGRGKRMLSCHVTARPDDERWDPYKETYPQFAKRTGLDVRPDEGDKKDESDQINALKARIDDKGYLSNLVWNIRNEYLGLPEITFPASTVRNLVEGFLAETAASDLAIAEAYRCGSESGKSEVEAELEDVQKIAVDAIELLATVPIRTGSVDGSRDSIVRHLRKRLQDAQDSTNTSESGADLEANKPASEYPADTRDTANNPPFNPIK